MPKFVIEREIPNIGQATPDDLSGAARKSRDVLETMGSSIQWVESFVTDNKIYCIYIAPDRSVIEEHAQKSGFPANSIQEIKATIDPTTGE